MVRMEKSIGLPRNDICPAGWGVGRKCREYKNVVKRYEKILGKNERGSRQI